MLTSGRCMACGIGAVLVEAIFGGYKNFLLDEARHRQLCDVLVASTAPTAADEEQNLGLELG